jgi:uncharacterized protein with PhoU and TrkA domain
MGIKRPSGKYIGAPSGKTVVKEEDILILYGMIEKLQNLEHRKEGATGDKEHDHAVNEEDLHKKSEQVEE